VRKEGTEKHGVFIIQNLILFSLLDFTFDTALKKNMPDKKMWVHGSPGKRIAQSLAFQHLLPLQQSQPKLTYQA
jgi:hypothetical protein